VESVASDSGQIVITLPLTLSETDQAYLAGNLVPGARVSKNKVWLRKPESEPEWKAQVLEVLEKVAASRPRLIAAT
jgi:hypothetical protein